MSPKTILPHKIHTVQISFFFCNIIKSYNIKQKSYSVNEFISVLTLNFIHDEKLQDCVVMHR